MTEEISYALLDLKARQETGEPQPCPRCGRDSMKPDLHTNALSRHADGIYICDDCGSAEAMLDFMHSPLPLECWAAFREEISPVDFKAVPGKEALKIIRAEHIPHLINIFKEWCAGDLHLRDLRVKALKDCPGLKQVWSSPFQALYEVADGEIIVRFKQNEETVEVAVDHLPSSK